TASDPEYANTLLRLAGLAGQDGGPAAAWATMPAAWARLFGGGGDAQRAGTETSSVASAGGASPSGPAAARHPSRGGGDDLALVADRLAAIETRLAALEAGARNGSRKPAAKPRKRQR